MMTLLGKGSLRLGGASSEKKLNIEGGFLQVVENNVRVVTERATPA